MENIIVLSGKVKYTITLDPTVWIFDDRKVDLTTYFSTSFENKNELEEYTKSVSKHWDREIMEGAVYPPTLKTEKKYEKEKVLTGSFGIPILPFLKNAELVEDAFALTIKTTASEHEISLDKAKDLILGFSDGGKPLSEDGPVHVYFGDGSNLLDPIKNVRAFIIK
ncbi:peptidyl-prolyl cis-trans isomerase [Neobacillus sp. YX16]|uniref:peptidyl-prolyl cis-trans isomerase n=1 Tax=Neobacillus sp. YX16 TaxID=3047874 RepID=UPI0024C3F3A6|nr:peptidyl-prolyl cis-trans isomerase [Neobacillus sp. YX16]WHZ04712.1 peptidyl-prolyl cis-trans isomerase [Neobacillus sp. YX16]